MITIDTIVDAKKQYIIDHVMPSDLDNDVKEGLKLKEEMIANVTAESIRELTPNVDDTIKTLNDQGVSAEKYTKFLTGEITQIELYEQPDPITTEIKYCIDNQDELTKYVENSTIEMKIPDIPNEEGIKETCLWVLIKPIGEMSDNYYSKNDYWSIIPEGTEPPPVPEFVSIHYKGTISDKELLPTSEDIGNVNIINNQYTYSDVSDLAIKLALNGLSIEPEKLSLWVQIGLIPSSQSQLPNFTKTTELKDGDFFIASKPQERCHIYYQKDWLELPKAFRKLTSVDNNSFLSLEKISFSESNIPESVSMFKASSGELSEDCTGGTYCLTDQLQNKKYAKVETDVFVYIHLTATKQQEKKQKSCSKSGNCSKSSSSCDKGQTDTAIQHNPAVNKEWFNNMMDNILHAELDPIIESITTLAGGVGTLASSVQQIGSATTSGGEAIINNGFVNMASAAGGVANTANSIAAAVPPRDAAVDAGCSLIMNAAEAKVNGAIDGAISDFNGIVDNTMNTALTAAMNSPVAMAAIDNRKFKSNTSANKALSTMNQSALKATTVMMANFSQSICDVRMMDDGTEEALEKIKSAIETAKQKAQQECEVEAAIIAAQYIKDCQS